MIAKAHAALPKGGALIVYEAAPLGREMPAKALTLRLVEEAIERFTQLNPK